MPNADPTPRALMVQVGSCRRCEYDLTGLPAGACPECGLAFDPSDPSPLRNDRTLRPLRVAWWACQSAPAVFMALTWLCALLARASLGHWPAPSRDDPKGIPLVSLVYNIWVLSMIVMELAVIPSVIAGVVLAVALGRRNRWRQVAIGAAAAGAVWGSVIVQRFADPLRLVEWLLD